MVECIPSMYKALDSISFTYTYIKTARIYYSTFCSLCGNAHRCVCLPDTLLLISPIKYGSKIQSYLKHDFISFHGVRSKYTQSECWPKFQSRVFETGSWTQYSPGWPCAYNQSALATWDLGLITNIHHCTWLHKIFI